MKSLKIYRAAILIMLLGCSARHESAAGAGGAAAGHDGGQSGAAGEHDASTEMLSCSERESLASNAVADALVGADRGCTTRSDCEAISIDTDCHAACGAVVATEHKAAVAAVIAAEDAMTCAGFESDGCMRVIPPCDPPLGVDCEAGRCIDGVADAGRPACTEHVIRWGEDGGLVASSIQFLLEPCARFRAFTMTPGQPEQMICDSVVPDDRSVSAGDLDALIASDDVMRAIADAPVVFGIDSRPVDGTVKRIEIDGAIIDVGGPCAGGAGCVAIPRGVSELATMLQSLVGQQHDVAPTCLNTT